MIPSEMTTARQFSFNMFFLYMVAALGLLLTTSLAALYAYVVKRGADLPNEVTLSLDGNWLGCDLPGTRGGLVSAATLSRTHFRRISNPTYIARRFAFLFDRADSKRWSG